MKTRTPASAIRGKQRRRRMLLVSAAPVLLAVALAFKLLSAGYLSGQAVGAFTRGDQSEVASAAAGMGVANLAERHKAPFAAGDALILGGDYTGARALFEAALADAPPADECKVRVNLVLSIEKLADKSAESAEARTDTARLYGEGLAVVEAAPPGCFRPEDGRDGTNGADGEGDRLREAEERLKVKAAKLGSQQAETDPGDGGVEQPKPPPEPQQSQLDKLKESGQAAQRERNEGRQRDEYLDHANPGPDAERPW